MDESGFHFEYDDIAVLAREWNIQELELFGSVVDGYFREDSDVDVLIQFAPDAHYSLFDFAELKHRLEKVFHRPIDLVEKSALHNPFRRKRILETAKVIYAA
jgi:hypothetical protein